MGERESEWALPGVRVAEGLSLITRYRPAFVPSLPFFTTQGQFLPWRVSDEADKESLPAEPR
jgi:hypothetical protein